MRGPCNIQMDEASGAAGVLPSALGGRRWRRLRVAMLLLVVAVWLLLLLLLVVVVVVLLLLL